MGEPRSDLIVLQPGVPLVDVERSGVVEAVHSGHAVLLDPAGRITATLGDPHQAIFPRSSNKPLQSVGLLRAGFDGAPPWIAMASASHSGEPLHLEIVSAMLASGELSEDELGCPPEWPLGEQANLDAIANGAKPRRLFMNCSGKHAAMLLTCQENGWPLGDYLDVAHPLQRQLHETVTELTDSPIAATGVDGCGAPLFALSLVALARAYARLATATAGPEQAVADAMRNYPTLVAGTGRSTTELMRAVDGLIAKDGAEGVYAGALPDGSAFALKIDDGAARAADRVAVAAVRALGADSPELDAIAEAPVLGGGRPVGVVRARPNLF